MLGTSCCTALVWLRRGNLRLTVSLTEEAVERWHEMDGKEKVMVVERHVRQV